MTNNMTSRLHPSQNYTLIIVFDQLKRYARNMKQCGEAELKKFFDFLNEVAPLGAQNRAIIRKRIEVETHLIPLEIALILGSSENVKQCQKSLHSAIDQLQTICISAGKKSDAAKPRVL